jgi:hypothetical protein
MQPLYPLCHLLTNHKFTTMLTFEFSMNILILLAVILSSFFIGFSLRKKQIRKNHSRVMQLESEMISNHAEILELQKEYITMELKLRGINDPVIQMKPQFNEKLPDGSLRKKMLSKDLAPARNETYQMIYDNIASSDGQRLAPDQY